MESNPVVRALEPVTRAACILCGWWLLVVAAFTCVEIVGRKLFGFSLQGVDEVGGYTLAIVATLSFSHALLTRAHTRIDFLIVKLGPTARAAFNVLAMVTLALMALFALWKGLPVLLESIEFSSHSTSPLQTPMWLPQGLWSAGLVLFALCATALAVHAVLLLARRRFARINTLYGPPSLDEEIDREIGALAERTKG
jgi:TRAP-type mannitol/chloroaromatic compound transport system permease small subunit